jgi:hypothetical protein
MKKKILKNLSYSCLFLLNSLSVFNNYLFISFVRKLSIFLLLLINQGIIDIFSNNLLYFIVIISFIKLFFNLILSFFYIFNLLIKKLEVIKNDFFNLFLNILKVFGLIVILNNIYLNYSEFLIFNELFIYILIYCIISLIITNLKIIINKIILKILKNIKMNILLLYFFNRVWLIKSTNINIMNNENNNNDNNLLNTNNNENNKNDNNLLNTNNSDNNNNIINSNNISSNNSTNMQIDVHAEEMVKKGIETVQDSLNKSLIQASSQIGLAGSIGAGMTAGASISKGQRPNVRIATTLGLGAAGAGIHIGSGVVNRMLIRNEEKNFIENNENPPSPVDSFINSPTDDLLENPVNALLISILILLYSMLLLLVILLFTYFSKIIFSYNFKLNWLDKIFPKEKSIKIRSIILNFLKLFSGIRDFNIIMLIFSLIFIMCFAIYFFSVFYFNLEYMCKLYLEHLKKK